MDKTTLLKDLKTYHETHGTLTGEYIGEPGSYCAVGYLLNKTGFSDEEIWGIEQDRLISYVLYDKDIDAKRLTDAGFSVLELQALQYANDRAVPDKEFEQIIDAMIEGRDLTSFSAHQFAVESLKTITFVVKEEEE
jgi:hypothetical protein